jgi:hypothetical protein
MYLEDKNAHIHFNYDGIHILRDYALKMVGANDEDSDLAREHFPNLIWHSDAEGYYVGFLPVDYDQTDEWNKQSQLWVGSVEGLYKELQKISTHMIQTKYEGEAKQVLADLLSLFEQVGFDAEENGRYAYIVFH